MIHTKIVLKKLANQVGMPLKHSILVEQNNQNELDQLKESLPKPDLFIEPPILET